MSNDGSTKVYLRRYDAQLKAIDDKETLVSEGLTTNCYPTIARRGAGDGFAVWLDRYPGKRRVIARYFNPSGQLHGADFPISHPTLKDQALPAIAVNDEGYVVVAWGEGTPTRDYFIQVRGFIYPANPR